MLLWTIIKVALKSLFANKLRSALAMLGIIIGVAAVIAMLGIGAGARKQVIDRIYSMGTDLLVVRPSSYHSRGVATGSQENLTLDDCKALLERVSRINQIAPVVTNRAQAKYLNRNDRTTVIGTTSTYFPIRNFEIERGRSFTEGEVEARARVCVIGPTLIENLFEQDEPLEAVIRINNINFHVIGVTKGKGDQGFYNPDDQIFMPYTTAMKLMFGVDYLSEIDIQCVRGSNLHEVELETSQVLRLCHRLQSDQPDDFYIRNQAEMVEMVQTVTRTFTILLGSIASISLLVGGIGIMNIMLVTVTERTREIGVRKAIGARDRDILRQFLLEALLMSALGGLAGVGVGVGSAQAIAKMTNFSTTIEPYSIILALSFSGAVGVFFGYYPARRAAGLDPIEALRYE